MVRISSLALFAALLVSAPELSFAEAAPALNPQMPRQTLKPRYQHNFPKHIKERRFNNGTTPTLAPAPQPTTTEAPLTVPPKTQQEASTDVKTGPLGIGVAASNSIVEFTANPTGVAVGILPGFGKSSQSPVTSVAQQSGQGEGVSVDTRSPSDSLSELLNTALNGVSGPPIPSPPSSPTNAGSSQNAAGPSSSEPPASPSSQPAPDKSASNAPSPSSQAPISTSDASSPNSQAPTPTSGTPSPNSQAPTTSDGSNPLVGGLTSVLGGVTSGVGAVTSALETGATPIPPASSQQVSNVGSSISTANSAVNSIVTPVVSVPIISTAPIVGNTDPIISTTPPVIDIIPTTPIVPVSTPTDAPTASGPSPTTAPGTLSTPTDTGVPGTTVPGTTAPGTSAPGTSAPGTSAPGTSAPGTTGIDSVPPNTASSPSVSATAQPETTQPTGPVTHTVVPIIPTTSAASQPPSASPETETAPTQTASASPQTQSASVAPSQPSPSVATQQPTQSATAEPATTDKPVPSSVTPAPTHATATAAPPTSIVATGSDTKSVLYVPTRLVTDTAPASTFSPPASTAAFSSGGIPSSMPHVITPPDTNGVLPTQPDNTTLIQIGFEYALNYPFVLAHVNAVYQIFDILPCGLAFGLGLKDTDITMQSLQPYDTTRTLGYITTVALAYIPNASVNNLTISVPNHGALLYKNTNDTRHALMSVIDPNFPVIAGAGMINGDSTTGGNPATTSTIVDQGNPVDANAANGTGVNGTAVGIGVGVCAGAAVYGAAMFFIAKRYKQRKSRHSRSSSMIDTASEVNSTHGQMAGANTALMADGTDGSYGTRGGSRNSNGSGHSSRGRGEISAPVMAENSLGWN